LKTFETAASRHRLIAILVYASVPTIWMIGSWGEKITCSLKACYAVVADKSIELTNVFL
jgi:hypothetical protein